MPSITLMFCTFTHACTHIGVFLGLHGLLSCTNWSDQEIKLSLEIQGNACHNCNVCGHAGNNACMLENMYAIFLVADT